MRTPCKDCTNRYVGCHSQCDNYKEYRLKLDKMNENRNQKYTTHKQGSKIYFTKIYDQRRRGNG